MKGNSHEQPDSKEVFTEIYKKGSWKGDVPSGPGSTLEATALLRPKLRELFDRLDIQTLCDAPCGDGSWIFEITKDLKYYFGFDVVSELVESNLRKDLPLSHFFRVADLTADILPAADAILCRDCLVHFPLETAQQTLNLFKRSGSRYVITTTFPQHEVNIQARLGTRRPLNLQQPPFNFPDPTAIIAERAPDPEHEYSDKSLGFWRLTEIPTY